MWNLVVSLWNRVVDRLGRRIWIRRIDKALSGAYERGLIDSWTLHEIDARAKGYTVEPYPHRPAKA